MVAPFWADVDTRPIEQNGRVWQQTISNNKFAVAWDHVGYYNEQVDKRNTFMVLISDGTDADMGLGNNVCFCYEDMEWTTGSASGGVDGFGGTQATVGVNEGAGDLGFLQIGRYNETGSATSAGIDNLDGESYCFDITTGVNVPPIVTGVPEGNMVSLECDEPLNLLISCASPEGDDTTIVTYTLDAVPGGIIDGFTIDIQDGIQTALVTIDWVPSDAVTHVLELTVIDSLGGVTNVPLTLTSVGSCSTAVPSQSSQPSKEPSSQPSVSVAPSSSKQPSYPPTSSPIQIPQQSEATCQEHLSDSLASLYSYLKSVNWWREWRTALKASWAKTYIWWAVKKDNCNYKLGKANRALGKLGCPVNDASPFSEICGQITAAVDCLEAECA